ncbi:hypothetical protein BT63DRAFT_451065 [Microthyrium microscopicum]|uniref:Uncharacterized protein n=1 Tax=Microthyrium microscopicum TaxID=703497 RepID=A0A6A6UL74_9PEZI|nr:hypothetical protein BT63DRAFT_451065 [Microthyrium microscopicum]
MSSMAQFMLLENRFTPSAILLTLPAKPLQSNLEAYIDSRGRRTSISFGSNRGQHGRGDDHAKEQEAPGQMSGLATALEYLPLSAAPELEDQLKEPTAPDAAEDHADFHIVLIDKRPVHLRCLEAWSICMPTSSHHHFFTIHTILALAYVSVFYQKFFAGAAMTCSFRPVYLAHRYCGSSQRLHSSTQRRGSGDLARIPAYDTYTPTAQVELQLPDASSEATGGCRPSIAFHLKHRQFITRTNNLRLIPAITTVASNPSHDGINDHQITFSNSAVLSTETISISEYHKMIAEHLATTVEAQTIAISSQVYREAQSLKIMKRTLANQLDRCMTTVDIFRVVAAALTNPMSTALLAKSSERLCRAFFRSRHTASDATIAAKLHVIIKRLDREGMPIQPHLFSHGLRFAIRSRNVSAVYRFLREYRDRNLPISHKTFRAVIAKCSIGRRGWGEIRNGRWSRADLLKVLLGFPDDVPGHECHLGAFINRDDWQFVTAWSQILSRCGAFDQLWYEWLLWRDSDLRRSNSILEQLGNKPLTGYKDWKTRGDRWFTQMFLDAGQVQHAWQIINETGLDPFFLRTECLHRLLEHPEYASRSAWNEKLRKALLGKLGADLTAIESFMGIKWVQRDGIAFHAPAKDFSAAFEDLSDPKFFESFGFITDVVS